MTRTHLVSNLLRSMALLLMAGSISPWAWASTVRHYFIAAEDVTWDFAPTGRDLMHNTSLPLPWSIQTKFAKTRYIEYTDAGFTIQKPQPQWLGILGPIIRAEVGDTIVVDFLNRSQDYHTIHPHGVRYDRQNEGAHYGGQMSAGDMVPPGAKFTYHWTASEESGPGPGDGSSVAWPYHSHVNAPLEVNAGLVGAIIITARGHARPDGSPKDVDREFLTLFMVFDQKNGVEAGLFHSINGYIFSNLQGLIANQGEHVRWYLMGMGSERDLHTPHWHGIYAFLDEGYARYFYVTWPSEQKIEPGKAAPFTTRFSVNSTKGLLGWVLHPALVVYSDGSRWKASDNRECFRIFWLKPDHPTVSELPPVRVD